MMINWRNVWVGVILGSCIVLAMGMTSKVLEPSTWNCYLNGAMYEIPPNMELVRCQPHFPKDGSAGHVFCHFRVMS